MHALVGQQAPFEHGRAQMQLLAGLQVTTKSVERIAEAIGGDIVQREQAAIDKALQWDLPAIAGEPIPVLYVQRDGTGVPVVKQETLGRQGQSAGQPAHTREVKLGCVFTQTTWDEEGFAIRDPDSTTYTRGSICGRWRASCIPRRTSPRKLSRMKDHQKRLLDKGKIEKLVSVLRSIATANPQLAEKIRTETDYFERNAERMRYPRFRRQHLFVGSGVIEAGCKTVVGSRLKQSGVFWTVLGANAILALRCSHLNGRFEDYWEQRREAQAA